MKRREFVTLLGGAGAAWPLAARAQQGTRVRRVGVLMPYPAEDLAAKARLTAFHQELERLGWFDGRNVQIDARFAATSDQYQPLARGLVALQPDVIMAATTQPATALQRETRTIPIVFTNVSDPIGAGFVTSLARPGGNLTGVLLYEAGITGKWLAMLKEIAPRLVRTALIGNPKTSSFDYFVQAAQAVVPAVATELVPAPIENTDADIEHIIGSFATSPNGGLLVLPDPWTIAPRRRDLIITLASRYGLPAVYSYRAAVEAGGLMSYGTDLVDSYRLSASFVDRILRGATTVDLPVQAPTRYETLVNLKTAKALGLDVPPSLLVRADEVIE
jgi:ABC-type uncharacterized transport system substrate-binding protein